MYQIPDQNSPYLGKTGNPSHQVDDDNTQGQLNINYAPNDPNNFSFTAVLEDAQRFTFEDIGAMINSADFESTRPNEDQMTMAQSVDMQQIGDNNYMNVPQQRLIHQHQMTLDPSYNYQRRSPVESPSPILNDCRLSPADQAMGHLNQENLLNLDNAITNKTPSPDFNKLKRPYVKIVEQPAKCALRFRYKCEGRSAGSLPGVNATLENKTFPAIKIVNYTGKAVVVVSCVTHEAPYRAHPHNIVGKEGCKKGICTLKVDCRDLSYVKTFTSLGIQCVKRKDIEESLTLREAIKVDPFLHGFAHKNSTSTINLNIVRLCFQVFIEGSTPNKFNVPLDPVVSEPVHDKKAMSDLVITKLSHCSAPATGGREVILLCDRITKDDIRIRFYEERDNQLVWETYTEVAPSDVHKQVAICFKTPKYRDENITQPVMAKIQLERVSDNQYSEPRLFQFLPCESDEDIISRKRQKIRWVNMNNQALDEMLQA